MFHHGDEYDDPKALSRSGDHNVWFIRRGDPVDAEIHKEIRIELASDDTDADEKQLMISVSVDADDEPAGDIAAAIGAVIDIARAEGREPTREEIEAAVSAIARPPVRPEDISKRISLLHQRRSSAKSSDTQARSEPTYLRRS